MLGILEELLGILGEELGMLLDEVLGILGAELGELDELGILGMLDDEDELEEDWQPTSARTVAPTRTGVILTLKSCHLGVFFMCLATSALVFPGSAQRAGFRGFGAVIEPSILRFRGLEVNRFQANFLCLISKLILANTC